MKRTSLLVLLALLVITVAGSGIARLLWLGTHLNAEGPLALAPARDGGFFLATDSQIIHFDADGSPLEILDNARIGVGDPGALQQTPDGALWVFDKAARRLLRCDDAWHCHALTSDALALDRNIQFSVNTARRQIAIADNNRHRLLLLDLEGRQLLDSGDTPPLHYPNQVSLDDDSLLVADTDKRDILRLPLAAAPGLTLGSPSVALHTRVRPYRFVHDDKGWWVLEAGETLINGHVAFYPGRGSPRMLQTSAADPVDLIDATDHLIVASRKDFRLLALDKQDGSERVLGGEQLNAAWHQYRQQQQAWRNERSRIPLLMMLVLLPALGGASVLQKQKQKQKQAESNQEMANAPANAPCPDGQIVLRPDASAQRAIREEFLVTFAGTLMAAVAIDALCWLSAGMPPPAAWSRQELWPLLAVSMLVLLLIPAGSVYAQRRRRERLATELVFGPHDLSLRRDGRLLATSSYDEAALDDTSLRIGKISIALFLGQGIGRKALWPYRTIRAVFDGRRRKMARPALTASGVRLRLPDDARALLLRQRLILRGTMIVLLALLGPMLLPLMSLSQKLAARDPHIYFKIVPIPLALLLALFLFLFIMERRFHRYLTQELLVTSRNIILFRQGRAVLAARPDRLFAGDKTLVMEARSVPLRFQNQIRRIDLFPDQELRDLLNKLLPADHVFASDQAMILSLLKERHPYAIKQAVSFVAALLGLAFLLWLRMKLHHIL